MKGKIWALACLAGLMTMACMRMGQKSENAEADSLGVAADSVQQGSAAAADTVKSIYKLWVSEDGDWLFDLRDDTHYVEARMYDEEFCKDNPDYKPGVFYMETEAGGFEVNHDFPEQGDSVGHLKYLLEDGPYAGSYALRFTFYDMTPKRATFLFEGEFEWKFKVLDEPVEILPNPHPYVFEE